MLAEHQSLGRHLALGMPAACSKPCSKVLFVFPCSSGYCVLGFPAHSFMALMQSIAMAITASDLLIVHLSSLLGQREKKQIPFQGLKPGQGRDLFMHLLKECLVIK